MNFTASLKKHFGRPIAVHLRLPSDRRFDERGICNVCGETSRFTFNSWVIPQEQRLSLSATNSLHAYAVRESLFCRTCYSSRRVRNISEALLSIYGNGAKSISELFKLAQFQSMNIAEINSIGSLGSFQEYLSRLPNLSYSEYKGPKHLGKVFDGIRNEDMCSLTYPDNSFDLVLSSDTLEHVPDFRMAIQETFRILRPGGRHIFTVPVVAANPVSYARATIDDAGNITHLVSPEYHGRGSGLLRFIPVSSDLLAFTEFGNDVESYLNEAGFETTIHTGVEAATGASYVYCARVPDE